MAANEHYILAYRRLASLYEVGCLGSPDYEESARWLSEAMKAGDPGAAGRMGYLLVSGRGVEKDEKRGRRLLKEAADEGDAFSQWFWGLLCSTENKRAEAFSWWMKSAQKGNADAQCFVGSRLLSREQNKDALNWLNKAAMQNHDRARDLLAQCYVNGWGVDVNRVEAHAWTRPESQGMVTEDSKELSPEMARDVAARARELNGAIEKYRIEHWEEIRGAHY